MDNKYEIIGYKTKLDFDNKKGEQLGKDIPTLDEAAKIANDIFREGKWYTIAYHSDDREEVKLLEQKKTPNVHLIRVTSAPVTNTKPSRVKLTSERFKGSRSVFISTNDYDTVYIEEIAEQWLKEHGFDVIGKAEGNGCMYVITDTFEPLTR